MESDFGPEQMMARLILARETAREAGRLLVKMQPRAKRLENGINLVTEADQAAETLISRKLLGAFPQDQLLGEEGAKQGQTTDILGPSVWIIDPLDGTNSYAHGIPHFSVSIAFAHNGTIKLGVVYDPNRDETFWALEPAGMAGGASFCNETPIQVSDNSRLDESMIATGFYYDRGSMMRQTLQSMERLFENNVQGIRRFGSAALDICWVACGRFDGYFEYQLSPWDFAAGWRILENAGGAATDRDGSQFDLNATGIIASNGKIASELASSVQWHDKA